MLRGLCAHLQVHLEMQPRKRHRRTHREPSQHLLQGSLTSEGLYGCALWGEAEGNEASQLVSVWQPVYGGQPVLAQG